jgi:hypothetical protein
MKQYEVPLLRVAQRKRFFLLLRRELVQVDDTVQFGEWGGCEGRGSIVSRWEEEDECVEFLRRTRKVSEGGRARRKRRTSVVISLRAEGPR